MEVQPTFIHSFIHWDFSFHVADIGELDFKLEVSADKKKTSLLVTDPLTALFKDGHQLNIRDVFSDQLMYKVTYRKNKSTGKVSSFPHLQDWATPAGRFTPSSSPLCSRKSTSPRPM